MVSNNFSIKNKILCITLLILIFVILIKLSLHFSIDKIGHDYSALIPALFEYKYFRLNNSILSVFLYSPTLCGVIPAFANPNNAFYAFYNLFVYINNFIIFQISIYLFCTLIAFYYNYKLLRFFNFTVFVSFFSSLIFSFSEFFYIKILVGHLKYTYFAFFPIIIYYFFVSKSIFDLRIIISIILTSSIIYGGSADLIPFLYYSLILTLALSKVLNIHIDNKLFLCKFLIYIIFSIGISLFKIVPSYLFLSNFERSEYAIKNVTDNVFLFLSNFFTNSFLPFTQKLDTILSETSSLGTWEVSFGLGLAGFLLFFLALLRININIKIKANILFLLLIVIFPFVFFVKNPIYDILIGLFPFNFYTHYQRYIYSYFPLIIFIYAIGFKSISKFKSKKLISIIYIVLALFFIFDKLYIPPWQSRSELFWDKNISKEIVRLSEIDYPKNYFFINEQKFEKNYNLKNTGIFSNACILNCYESIFGYNNEKLSLIKLKTGQINLLSDSHYNAFKPDCFLKFNSYNCKPGDLYSKDDFSELNSIQGYISLSIIDKPYYFFSFLISIFLLILLLIFYIYEKKHFNSNSRF